MLSQAQRSEAMVKTDYIFTIAKDIEWDNEQSIPKFHFGVLGANDIYKEIQSRANSFQFKEKPIDVTQFRTIRDISFVHILVIGKERNGSIQRIYERARSPGMLIVTDSCMEYQYIMVNLLAISQPLQQYELNSKNINEANLMVNPKLLYYAGSEADLRDIYKDSEEELSKVRGELEGQRKELQQLYEELQMKKEEISLMNNEIEEQQDNLSGLLDQVRNKQDTLNQKISLLNKQESIIKGQQADIRIQRNELLDQASEIEEGNKVLENQQTEIKIQQTEIKNQLEKINNQNSILTKQTLKIEQQQNILYVFIAFFILIAGLVFFIFRAYKIKKTANKELKEKNEAINKQNVEISQQKEEITAQREQLQIINREIEKQNRNTKSSIEYALTIQRALLPLQAELDSVFESFIIYRPKDIVSGDFYWFARLPSETPQSENNFVAVVDCTGHGVPGAFLSAIGIKLLNGIIMERKVQEPSKILELLNAEVNMALKQETTENDDGMDVCLCLLQKDLKQNTRDKTKQKYKITYAGARRPLYYYVNSSSELKVLAGDRKTVGGKYYKEQIFTDKELLLETGDRIYLTTDGMADQNASNREKFGTKRLLHSIRESAILPMDKQRQTLEEKFDAFMQNEKQRDDIAIIGLRL
jgi:serine phosphatase RsbU (regulator of sigma subunit)